MPVRDMNSRVVFSIIITLLCHDIVVVGTWRLNESHGTCTSGECVGEEQEAHEDCKGGQTGSLGVDVPGLIH